MKCIVCGISIQKAILHRTNVKGQSNAGWTCMPCIEKHEPELANNIKHELTHSAMTAEQKKKLEILTANVKFYESEVMKSKKPSTGLLRDGTRAANKLQKFKQQLNIN